MMFFRLAKLAIAGFLLNNDAAALFKIPYLIERQSYSLGESCLTLPLGRALVNRTRCAVSAIRLPSLALKLPAVRS